MLANLSFKYKLMIVPVISLLSFGIFLAFVISVSNSNIQRINNVRNSSVPLMDLTGRNLDLIDRMQAAFNDAVTTGEVDMLHTAADTQNLLQSNLAGIAELAPDLDGKLKATRKLLDNYAKESDSISRAMIAGDASLQTLNQRAKKKQAVYDDLNADLHALRDEANRRFVDITHGANEASRRSIHVGIALGTLMVILLLSISLIIALAMRRQVANVADSMRAIAEGEGDLTQRLRQEGTDEVGELVRWFNLFVEKLHHAVSDVVAVTDPLAHAGTTLHNVANRSQSNSSAQQESTRALMDAMGELLLSVSNIAESCAATAAATTDADGEAKRGTQKVADTVASINNLANEVTEAAGVITRLQKDADDVGGILDVIKNIAEQTNLLALNAAIEAARAGEQGRGFAVVADEVRTLASRTQQSTLEIQKVIGNLREASKSAVAVMNKSQERARDSVEQATQAGDTLNAISHRVALISDMSHQIAAATEQQDQTTRAIQGSIASMNDAAGNVATSTHEVHRLSEELRGFVAELRAVASQFRV